MSSEDTPKVPNEASQPEDIKKPASMWPEPGVWPPQPDSKPVEPSRLIEPTPAQPPDAPAEPIKPTPVVPIEPVEPTPVIPVEPNPIVPAEPVDQAPDPTPVVPDKPVDQTPDPVPVEPIEQIPLSTPIDLTVVDGTSADTPPKEEKKKKKRVGGFLLILLSVLLIVGGVWLGIVSCYPSGPLPNPFPPTASGIPDMDGNIVIPDDTSATDPEFQKKSDMVVDMGGSGFQIPSVFLDVPLGSVLEVDGKMNPANFQSVFWVRNRGVSLKNAEKGTVYMVAHSAHGGRAPGNYVQKDEKVIVYPGDIIKANERTYSVTETRIIPFKELNKHTDLWEDQSARLVFITCLQNNLSGAKTNANLIIIAKLVS